MVKYAGKARLQALFSRLSEEKKSEILGMAEAFTYAQRTGSEPTSGTGGSTGKSDRSGARSIRGNPWPADFIKR
jgi:hypothetical protein